MSTNYVFTQPVAKARQGYLLSAEITLSATPETVTTVAIPDTARSFRVFPDADIRFAINEDPVAAEAVTDTTVGLDDLSVGGVGVSSVWSEHTLESGTGRTLRLIGASGSETVYVEFN